MIRYTGIYDNYITVVSKELDITKETYNKYIKSFEVTIEQIKNISNIIKVYTDLDEKTILTTLSSTAQVHKIKWIPIPSNHPSGLNVATVQSLLLTFVNLKSVLKTAKESIAYWEARFIDKALFKTILCEANELIVDALIKNAYELRMGYGLGDILVRGKKRNYAGNLWGEANKNKKQILEEGGTPYHPIHAPDGEHWMVYDERDIGYFFAWTKRKCNVKNNNLYYFFPTKGPNGNARKLIQYINNNPTRAAIYPVLLVTKKIEP